LTDLIVALIVAASYSRVSEANPVMLLIMRLYAIRTPVQQEIRRSGVKRQIADARVTDRFRLFPTIFSSRIPVLLNS
jgi:hypothetical protein